MKVIFLDFDGVLNNHRYFAAHYASGLTPNLFPRLMPDIDPKSIAILNEIVDKTGAVVVVSSSWRVLGELEWLREVLATNGFRGTVIGKTPIDRRFRRRGNEIHEWLKYSKEPVSHYVILDDDTDMEHLSHKLVKIDGEYGLTNEYLPDILRHFE